MNMPFQQLMRNRFFAHLLIGVAVVGGASSSVAWAQFEDVSEAEEAAANKQGRRGQFEISEDTFDQWIYGGRGQAKKFRTRLDSMVSLQIEKCDQYCHLSSEQKDLLLLAASGDITRLEDQVWVVREKTADDEGSEESEEPEEAQAGMEAGADDHSADE